MVSEEYPLELACAVVPSGEPGATSVEQLTAEASQQPMQEVIGEAVDLVVSIERTGKGRRVREVIHIEGYRNNHYQTEHYAQIDEDSHVA